MIRLLSGIENEMCSLWVAILTSVLLQVKAFVLYPCHYDQEVLPGEVQMFLGVWQQGLYFANLPLLGSCTYSHSYSLKHLMPVSSMWPIASCYYNCSILHKVPQHVSIVYLRNCKLPGPDADDA